MNHQHHTHLHPSILVSILLVVIGALNWGLVGLFRFNLVGAIFRGDLSTVSRIIYVIVAMAGLYLAANTPRLRSAGPDERHIGRDRPAHT